MKLNHIDGKVILIQKLGGTKVGKITMMQRDRTVDHDGVIVEETEQTTFNFGKEPDYIKVYLDDIIFLSELPNWISKVLYKLIKSVSYANKGQYVIINAGYKRIIAEELEIKPQSVTNAINQLTKKNILIKKEAGVFLLNPQFFGKGEWKDISKIRYEVEISENQKSVKLIEKVEEEEDQISVNN